MSSSVASMKKWGIPPSARKNTAPEITLLERLVWVRYQGHWWPALLYHSYSELQQHLYDQLDMVLKAQFAMAIMRHMQDKHELKIARLLGRPILEVIEVEEDCYCEFYWQLPNVLPKACKRSRYGDNLELYFDFHRALDQVEDIIRDVSEENFALMPHNDHLSWLERAEMALSEENGEVESTSRRPKVIQLDSYQPHHPSPPSLQHGPESAIARTDSSPEHPIVVEDYSHIHGERRDRYPGHSQRYSPIRSRGDHLTAPRENHQSRSREKKQPRQKEKEEVQVRSKGKEEVQVRSKGKEEMQVRSEEKEEVQVRSKEKEAVQVRSKEKEEAQIRSKEKEEVQIRSKAEVRSRPVEEPSNIWNNMMKSISASFGDDSVNNSNAGGIEVKVIDGESSRSSKRRDPNGTLERVDRSDPAGSAIDSRSQGPVRDPDLPSPVSPKEEDGVAPPKNDIPVVKGESLVPKESSEATPKKKDASRKSRVSASGKKKGDKGGRKSAASNKSSSSETSAGLNSFHKKIDLTDRKIRKQDQSKPSPEKRVNNQKKAQSSSAGQPVVEEPEDDVVDETRDPPSESAKSSELTKNQQLVKMHATIGPTKSKEVLPGLEGDDIMPGLSEKVSNAQNIWTNVWSNMMLTKDGNESVPVKIEQPTKATVEPVYSPPATQKGEVVHVMAGDTPMVVTDLVLDKPKPNLSLWQRMTNCA